MKNKRAAILIILLAILAILYFFKDTAPLNTIVSSIPRSIAKLNQRYQTALDIQEQPEKDRAMKITLDGQTTFSFVNPPIYDGTLWLPASEVMRLFDYRSPEIKEGKVSCGRFDEQGKYRFAFYQAGSYGYSVDADAEDYITALRKPYTQNGEIFVPESSMETLTGDVFSYNKESNTLNITHGNAISLQQENPKPLQKIIPQTSRELNDNRLMQHINPLDEYVSYWKNDNFVAPEQRFAGWKWLQISLETPNWQESHTELPDFYTDDDFKRFFQAVDDYGMYLSYNLTFKDKEFRRSGGGTSESNLNDPEQVKRYKAFVAGVVSHYKGVIDDYMLWYGPDTPDQPSYVAVEDYISMLQQVVPLIKSIDPQATVSIGYTTPNYQDASMSWPYLDALVSTKAVRLADHIAIQPFYFISPEYFPDYYYNYPQRIAEIQEKAHRNGFEGDFWSSEGDYCPREYGPAVVDNFETYPETIAVKYLQRINAINIGIGLSGGDMGTLNSPLSYDALSRSAMLYSGVQAADIEFFVQSDVQPIRSYSYRVDGGRLLAFWYDGPAFETALNAFTDLEIQLPDCQHIYAYDVYHGFFQELEYSSRENGVILHDVTLQDYPIYILIE